MKQVFLRHPAGSGNSEVEGRRNWVAEIKSPVKILIFDKFVFFKGLYRKNESGYKMKPDDLRR